MSERLASLYRPSRFEDVRGQETAVRITRNLLASEAKARHVLYYGTVGSGKTTMARLYGRALNCQHRGADGSPCQECVSCTDEAERNYHEFDIPGDKDVIQRILSVYRRPSTAPFRVLFLDEVHALKKEDSDTLLKRIEDPEPGVIFIMATTEPENVRRALVSRFMPIEIRRLPRVTAFELLKSVADKAGLKYEPDALMLLAGLSDGYPRDLLNRLELVREERLITRDLLLELFDLNREGAITAYFHALADGDEVRQYDLFERLNETVVDKVRWIKSFLLKIYYVSKGQKVDVDPVIDTMQPEVFREIADRFVARLGPLRPETWLDLLDTFSSVTAAPSSAAARLCHAQFEYRINHGLVALATEHTQASSASEWLTHAAAENALEPIGSGRDSHFLDFEDVRRVVNSASFLIQHYGVLFNARLTLDPGALQNTDEAEVRSLMTKLLHELERRCRPDVARPFSWIMTTKRTAEGPFCDAVLYLPPSLAPEVRNGEWLSDWVFQHFGIRSTTIASIRLIPSATNTRALKFHWDHALAMLAGISDRVVASTMEDGLTQQVSIRKLLGIGNDKPGGSRILNPPIVEVSPPLGEKAVAMACEYDLTLLSAFDAHAWQWIREGWELQECRHRKGERRERERTIRALRSSIVDSEELTSKLRDQYNLWRRTKAEDRERRWRGWWETESDRDA